jgi:hypothetical protein
MKPGKTQFTPAVSGDRFGNAMFLSDLGMVGPRRRMWRMRCGCGAEYTSLRKSVIEGKALSCGCSRKSTSLVVPGALTQESLKALFDYDPETGVFSRKPISSKIARYTKVGRVGKTGYLVLAIAGRLYKAHRLAWLYTYGEMPSGLLDHIDANPLNNSISNLRLASPSENSCNARRRRNNKSGVKGVYFQDNRWVAEIQKGGQRFRLGRFDTLEEAARAYTEAAKRLHGEFARVA